MLRALVRVRWILFLGLVVFLGRVWEGDLRLDGIRYAAVAKELLANPNPLLPTFGGVIYLNKPPLFLWSTAAAMALLGVNALSAKLVSVGFGLALLAGIFHVARRIFGSAHVGFLAAAVFATTYTVFRNTDDCRMESMLAFFLLAALLAFRRRLDDGRRAWALLSGLASGLAVLTKGPVGLAALVAVALDLACFERERRGGREWLDLLLALGVAIALGGWWYAYAWAAAGPAFEEAVVRVESLDVLAGGVLAPLGLDQGYSYSYSYEAEPAWTYLAWLATRYFYWLPFLILGAVALLRERRRDPTLRLLLVFAVLIALGAQLTAIKAERYLYPALPVWSLVTAYGLARLVPSRGELWVAALALTWTAVLLLFPGPLRRDAFLALREARAAAEQSGLALVVDPDYWAGERGRAAVLYYLDDFAFAPPAAGPYLLVTSERTEREGLALFASRRARIYLVGEADRH